MPGPLGRNSTSGPPIAYTTRAREVSGKEARVFPALGHHQLARQDSVEARVGEVLFRAMHVEGMR